MSKTTVVGLFLLALSIVVLLLTAGKSEVPLLFTDIKARAAMIYFGFLVDGVIIGLLLHK